MANSTSPIANGLPPFETLGSYKLLAKIGQGGMGSVYLARHLHLNRIVALKTLAPSLHGNAGALARFRKEVEAIGRLKHPHIIAATDAGEAHGCHYLVMEYVEGVDLARLLRQVGRFPIPDACELARQVAAALTCINQHGLVHRDIKPSNLLLGQDGVLRVLDLGLARLQEPTSDQEALTHSNDVMGTGDFIAPEQALSSHHVDIRADLYSLGCTLYAMLSGKPPFAAPPFNNFIQKVRAHQETAPAPIQSLRPDVPPALSDLMDRLLAKNPSDRIETPVEAARLLERFTSGHDLGKLLQGMGDLAAVPPGNPGQASTLSRQNLTQPRQEDRSGEQAHGQHLALLSEIGSRPTKTLEPAPTDRRRFTRSWLWAGLGLAFLLLLIGLASWLALLGPRPIEQPPAGSSSQTDPGNPNPSHAVDEDTASGRWRDLLDRPPVALQWPRPVGVSRLDFKDRQHELWVNVDGESLLQLGETTDAAYEIEVGVEQVRWGGVGLFFGRHDDQFRDQPCQKYQLVQLVARLSDQPQEHCAIDRTVVSWFTEKSQVGIALKTAAIPWPTSQEHRLKIAVGKKGLRSVCWDGAELWDLVASPSNDSLRDADYRGAFGVFNTQSSSIFRNARYRTLLEEP